MESAITYHETQIVAVTKLRDDTTEALDEAEKEVRTATKDLEQNEETFASESALRQQQHTTFEEKDAEHDANIVAIDEASKIVQHLQAGVAFSQLRSRFDKVTARLTETKHALFKVFEIHKCSPSLPPLLNSPQRSTTSKSSRSSIFSAKSDNKSLPQETTSEKLKRDNKTTGTPKAPIFKRRTRD